MAYLGARDGWMAIAGYALGSAAGATLAGRAREGANPMGALAGVPVGATPLLLMAAQKGGPEYGAEILVVPVIAVTIPVGAAVGHGLGGRSGAARRSRGGSPGMATAPRS